MTTYWFTGCQHFFHEKILEYCNRPFPTIVEHDEKLIENHNEVVGKNDIVIHAGDFTLINNKERVYREYVKRLKGNNIFLRGSHDYWLPKLAPFIFQKEIDGNYIVVCHYAMRVWARSHYNSWQLYSHSHGRLEPQGKQHDVSVDNNNFYPVSYEQIVEIMKEREDNFNLVKEKRRI